MKKICLINSHSPHYRLPIFQLMDKELSCHFYLGNFDSNKHTSNTKNDRIKALTYSDLYNFKKELKNKTFIRKPFYYQKGAISLIFKDYDIYIVSGEPYCISTWIILLLSKFSSKKIYLWTHGWYGKESLSKKIIKKIFFKLADGILLYGDYAKDLMIKEGFNANKLHVIYNSLDYDKQVVIRKNIKSSLLYQDHFNNSNPNIIYIGRITIEKKLELLIQAIKLLNKKNFFVNLIFIGNGTVKQQLKNLCKDLNIENFVWFFGASYDETEISQLVYDADACISPGNVGLTAMHSMVYGTPVITHNNFSNQMPEFEAVEEGKTGCFFEENNIESLANAIQKWLFYSKHNRENIRKNCYKMIDSHFNPHYQIKVIKDALNQETKDR